MRVITCGFIVTAMAIGGTTVADTAPLTGRFLGTGRACYGTLAVRTKTISWLTTFSQCQSVPYKLLERSESSGQLRLTYRFEHAPASCRYRLVSVTHESAAGKDVGWEVTGYGSEGSYNADKSSGYTAKDGTTMSCYLVRDPGKAAGANASR
jgi:hypothetical protein